MTHELTTQLQLIVQHAYANAPAIKIIFNQANLSPDDIQTLNDLEKIPVTSKDRLVELQQTAPPFGGFLAVPLDRVDHVFFSPGPLYEPHAEEATVLDTIREMLTIAGFTAGDVAINAFGYHLIPTGLAVDHTLRQMGVTVIPAGVGNADLLVKMMLDLETTAYVGTPSWLMALIQKAEEMGVNINEKLSLRKALVSAEPLPPSLRQTFVDRYGIRVTNAYGTAELGFLAYDTEGEMAMRLLNTSIVQVVNPETGHSVGSGEVGEVVVTTFNKIYPLIRLGTGDLAMNVDPSPGLSRQEERSIILVGRVGDAVKVRGMFVHPNQLRFAIAQVPGVARFQAVVTRPENRDEFTLYIVTTEETDASPADRTGHDALSTGLSNAIQAACRIKVDRIEFVLRDAIAEETDIILDQRTWE